MARYDGRVTDPTSSPGERRLDRPPSDRYAGTAPPPSPGSGADADPGTTGLEPGPDARGSLGRGIALGTLAGIAGGIATVVLGGLLAITAGLLVVASATGYAVAAAVRFGAGTAISRSARRVTAVALAIDGVILGQLGLWLLARTEGGVLSLPDYLGQTFGILVPIQFAAAILVAWWTAR